MFPGYLLPIPHFNHHTTRSVVGSQWGTLLAILSCRVNTRRRATRGLRGIVLPRPKVSGFSRRWRLWWPFQPRAFDHSLSSLWSACGKYRGGLPAQGESQDEESGLESCRCVHSGDRGRAKALTTRPYKYGFPSSGSGTVRPGCPAISGTLSPRCTNT